MCPVRPGVTGDVEEIGTSSNVSPGSPVAEAEVACPARDLVTGGGWSGSLVEATVSSSEPTNINGAQGWAVIVAPNAAATGEESFHAVAQCATT